MKALILCHCGNKYQRGTKCPCSISVDRARKSKHDRNRPSARERGYDSKWDKARQEFLQRFPKCRRCDEPATTVDHIRPHRGDPRVFWDFTNWQPLCTHHHNSTKQRLERNSK